MQTEQARSLIWKKLFEEAIRFKQQASWTWMTDDLIFGVQNPENGEIGYCVIMGNLGEIFGLGVYLGNEGLESIKQMQSFSLPPQDLYYAQKCISVFFEDREELSSYDYKLIKELGFSFRGKKQWPQFRNFLPGYYPWYITESDAKFLTLALEQAILIAERAKTNSDFLISDLENSYYVRVPIIVDNELQWTEKYIEPIPATSASSKLNQTIRMDEIFVHKLKRSVTSSDLIWEMDYFYSPMPVQETKDQRPYYPYVLACIDQATEQIINFKMINTEELYSEMINLLLETIERFHILPRSILVSKKDLYKIFEPLAKTMNFKVTVQELIVMQDARNEMCRMLAD